MKPFLSILIGMAASVAMAQAVTCPEANYDGCSGDGYSIVEVEPNVYWPHNQMEAAHWTGAHTSHRHIVKRHHRVCRTHHMPRRHHAKRCSCRCR